MSPSTAEPTTCCAVDATVIRVDRICRQHVAIELECDALPHGEPGQFLLLLCRSTDEAAPRAFLRRPFSIADQHRTADGHVRVLVISRAVGPGTRWLDARQPGETISITGPLGSGFRLPATDTPVVLVGGGVGIPPLLFLSRRLRERGHASATAVFGAMSRDLLPLRMLAEPDRDGSPSVCVQLPGDAQFPSVVTTDDGSAGLAGVVTDALALLIRDSSLPTSAIVYACGPEPMLRAVGRFTAEHALACQLCIERQMGCGLGACQSCVVRTRDTNAASGWRWSLACVDGPVYDRDDLPEYVSQP